MKKNYNALATLFGGWFGLHKYIAGEIGMGIVYTCTGGLLGIGWLWDVLKTFSSMPSSCRITNKCAPLTVLPICTPNGIVLNDGELCHYQGPAFTEKTSSRIAGYTSQYTGGNVRIAKGLSIHSGGSERQAVHETLTERSNGILYITNHRIIFIAPKSAFDKPLNSLSAYVPNQGHITLLFGNHSYDLITDDAFLINNTIDGIFQGLPTII